MASGGWRPGRLLNIYKAQHPAKHYPPRVSSAELRSPDLWEAQQNLSQIVSSFDLVARYSPSIYSRLNSSKYMTEQ